MQGPSEDLSQQAGRYCIEKPEWSPESESPEILRKPRVFAFMPLTTESPHRRNSFTMDQKTRVCATREGAHCAPKKNSQTSVDIARLLHHESSWCGYKGTSVGKYAGRDFPATGGAKVLTPILSIGRAPLLYLLG